MYHLLHSVGIALLVVFVSSAENHRQQAIHWENLWDSHVNRATREPVVLSIILSPRDQTHLCHNLFFPDILMTRSPEFITHALLDIVFLRFPSALPLCIWALTTSPSTLVCTVAIIFGRNGIFICNVMGWYGYEEKKMKMKIEDARKKPQDWRWVGWSGLGWQSWTTFMLSLSSVVVDEFWLWLQCARNWLGRQSSWWSCWCNSGVLLWHLAWLREGWFGLSTSHINQPYVT